MFVKLTSRYRRLPVWVNSAFVASIEKCEHGGSIVGPLGAGIDFEVFESPEQIISLMGVETVAAPQQPQQPQQPANTPPPRQQPAQPRVETPPAAPAYSEQDAAALAAATVAIAAEASNQPAATEEKKPTKAARKTTREKTAAATKAPRKKAEPKTPRKAKTADEAAPAEPPAPLETPAAAPTPDAAPSTSLQEVTASSLPEQKLERLRKLAPGSLSKLRNTLEKQFRVSNPDATMDELAARGEFTVAGNRVIWPKPVADPDNIFQA